MPLKGYLIELSLKFELEDCRHDIEKIDKYLKGKCWTRKAAHMRKAMKFVVVTPWDDLHLVQRLNPVIDNATSVEEFWVYDAPKVARSGSAGNFDPFRSALVEMGIELRHPTYFKDMREPKRFANRAFRAVQNRDRSTVR